MNDNEELEVETELVDEESILDSDLTRRQIFTEIGDPEVESLFGKYKRGKLLVQPDFQRQFVWDTAKASRLIESVFLGIPIPLIYISQEADNKEHVIDGQQRLTSFFSFIDGKFPDGRDFKLSGLSVFSEHNGSKFGDLSEELQDSIKYFKVRTITFKKESAKNLKFEIFERLNSGSVALNDQELRNCIYRGKYNSLLRDLSREPDYTYLLGIKSPDRRMRDVEFVLRFAAFFHATYLKYKPPMRNFLNADAERYQDISDRDAEDLRVAFKRACQITRSMFGKNAFKRFYKGDENGSAGRWEPKKFNASLFDVIMYTMAQEEKNVVFGRMDAVREALIHLMAENQEFTNAIELSTSSLQAVTKRFDIWRRELQQVLGVGAKEPRCFSSILKQALFDLDPTCAICAQKIHDMDDSAVDHIEQYWRGGKTIPENARLTHRYCNWARARTETI